VVEFCNRVWWFFQQEKFSYYPVFFGPCSRGYTMWHDLAVAGCLVLILEGILPFLRPASWRRTILMAASLDDSTLRRIGLISMLLGTAL
jgi:uncharacterized protein YjeT (DUF2065 family)